MSVFCYELLYVRMVKSGDAMHGFFTLMRDSRMRTMILVLLCLLLITLQAIPLGPFSGSTRKSLDNDQYHDRSHVISESSHDDVCEHKEGCGHNTEECDHNTEECDHNTEECDHNTKDCDHNTEECDHNTEECGHQTEGCDHNTEEVDLKDNLLNTKLVQNPLSRSDDTELDVTIEDGAGDGEAYDPEDGLVIKGDIVTMDDDMTVIEDGRLIVMGEKIVAVLESDDVVPGDIDISNSKIIDSDGYIFPGLINGHNHVHYNCMPIWDAPGRYTNRYQWGSENSYKTYVTYPNKALKQGNYYNVLGEAMKYAEVKELVSGTTAVQNSKMSSKGYEKMMVRNIEFANYGGPRAHATVAAVGDFDQDKADGYIENYEKGTYNAMFLHISEGLDEKSRAEFDTLRDLGLARKETIVIHGAALGQDELEYMGRNNMTMVWSPVSNLILYGGTADIPTALDEGVNICLGTDWSPSGGKNLLMELKIADQYDNEYFGNVIEDSELVKMVTCNPADAVSWTGYSGRLMEGLFADIAVYNKVDEAPYRSLIDSTEVDVQLVLIGGDPLYGNVEYMEVLKPGDHEVIDTPFGFKKAIDVTKEKDEDGNNIFMGDQKLSELKELLEDCLEFDMNYMEENFRGDWVDDGISFEEYVEQEFSRGVAPVGLDPFYHCVDPWFFDSLREINYGDFEFGVQDKYYHFMINGSVVNGGGGGIGNDEPDGSLEILRVTMEPASPSENENIVVSAEAVSNHTIGELELVYRLSDGPPARVIMEGTGGKYHADIGTFPGGSVLLYYVNASDVNGNKVTSEDYSISIRKGSKPDDEPDDDIPPISENNDSSGTTLILAIVGLIVVLTVVVIVLVILIKRNRKDY